MCVKFEFATGHLNQVRLVLDSVGVRVGGGRGYLNAQFQLRFCPELREWLRRAMRRYEGNLRTSRSSSEALRSGSAGLVLDDSAFALIIRAAADGSFAHEGMSPHRTNDNSRTGSFGFWRMIGTGWVGAML